MLKRTLIIGLLLTLGVVLMGASPPTVHTVTFQTDSGEGVLFWFEAERADNQAVLTAGPDYQPIEIPSDVLDALPAHVSAAFQGDFTNSNAYNINGCIVHSGTPYLDGSDVEGRIDISCIATNVVETRLQGRLSKGSTTLDSYDSGWQTWKSHGQTLSGACIQATNTYKNWAKGWVKFTSGGTDNKISWRTKSLTCPQVA